MIDENVNKMAPDSCSSSENHRFEKYEISYVINCVKRMCKNKNQKEMSIDHVFESALLGHGITQGLLQ